MNFSDQLIDVHGFTLKEYKISQLVEEKDRALFAKIVKDPDHALHNLLPERRSRTLRERKRCFMLPLIKTKRFKRTFLNRCLFVYFN